MPSGEEIKKSDLALYTDSKRELLQRSCRKNKASKKVSFQKGKETKIRASEKTTQHYEVAGKSQPSV